MTASAIRKPAPASPANLTPFVTADLRFDIAAIRADAKSRYARKLEFIGGYTGAAKRYWQWRQARQAVRQAWREAKWQLHCIAFERVPYNLPYTRDEASSIAILRNRIDGCGVTAQGNADFKAAAGEYSRIVFGAQQRAYFAVIRQARGGL